MRNYGVARTDKHWWELARDYIFELKPKSILDVGCGEAMLWRAYGYLGRHDLRDPRVEPWKLPWECKIVLLDLDLYKHPLPTIQADGEKLPFKDKSFELVIATEVLEHVDNPEKLASEVRTVGVYYFLTTPIVFEPVGEECFEQNPWRINLIRVAKSPKHNHQRLFSKAELRVLFPEAEIFIAKSLDTKYPYWVSYSRLKPWGSLEVPYEDMHN